MRDEQRHPQHDEPIADGIKLSSRAEERDDTVFFIKPRRQRRTGGEPKYQMSIRAPVSVVARFHGLADERRLSNPELLELLLDIYDRQKIPS